MGIICTTHKKSLGQAAAVETIQSGGVNNFWPVPNTPIPHCMCHLHIRLRRLQIFSIDIFVPEWKPK